MKYRLIVGALGFLTVPIAAQNAQIIPNGARTPSANDYSRICVTHEGRDTIGSQATSQLRDKIAGSPRYTYVTKAPCIKMIIKSLDVGNDDTNTQSGVSMVLVYDPGPNEADKYINDSLFIYGRNNISVLAGTMYANVDKWITYLTK